ncbi:hypothetical protein CEB3_c05320 [Peptococcaceae bacterium CEB3]|nr:hypothetical protein CEB3_c05320 [Peptococcaceae bacterium CEB3]
MHVSRRTIATAYVIAVTFIVLAMAGTFSHAYKMIAMQNTLERAVQTSATAALRDNVIPNTATGEIRISDTSVVRHEFETKLQNRIQGLPEVTYTLQAFRVFTTRDGVACSLRDLSRAGIYVAMIIRYAHEQIPIYRVITAKSSGYSTPWHPEQGRASL